MYVNLMSRIEKGIAVSAPPHFGYSSNNAKITISNRNLSASKKDPNSDYGFGVVLAEFPVIRESIFEVAIDRHGSGWSGSFKIGLIAVARGALDSFSAPRYSPDYARSWVWSSSRLYTFCDADGTRKREACREKFSAVNLEELACSDTFGFRVTTDKRGTLEFYANGDKQGEVTDVYGSCPDGMDLYPMVDHYAKGVGTTIIRADTDMKRTLQRLCQRVITSRIKNVERVEDLPLPPTLKKYLQCNWR
eukprot:m.31485 g.31485  ORF g.31485 m.31485 type:complete len:248 (+) comp31502_c0_seq3:34-777(+)